LEDIYSGHFGVAGGDRRLDADAVEYLELIRVTYVYFLCNFR
jgi:hypothetical protein